MGGFKKEKKQISHPKGRVRNDKFFEYHTKNAIFKLGFIGEKSHVGLT